MKKETVGKLALDLQKKDEKVNPIELQRSIHKGSKKQKSYEEEVWTTVKRGRSDPSMPTIFYVVVLFKKERLLHNVLRQYFFYRSSCPTPQYDQTVYKYDSSSDSIEYLWTIPDNVACLNLPLMKQDLDPEQLMLVQMIEDFRSGKLDQKAMNLNNEKAKLIL